MKTKTLALATVLLATSVPAAAQVTTYGDQGSFSAAAGPVTTETFSSCPGNNSGFSGSVSSTTGPCGGIVAGVTFAPEQANGQLYSAGAGQSTNPTTALGLNIFLGDSITITFDNAISAWGADLFQNYGGGGQGSEAQFVIALFGPGDVLIDTLITMVSPNGGDFFGFTSTTPFVRVDVAQTSGFAVIDNVQWSSSTAVPEPATWAMMLLGFGAIGFSLRRRNSARTMPQLA
jgi:PEP-CTERM motif